MKRTIVATMALALLVLTSGTASADWSSEHGAFPRPEDPWQNWGKPHPTPPHVHPSHPYHVNHYYVWVPAYSWWDGTQWVLVPGYWRVW
jgi:hypothetical protein